MITLKYVPDDDHKQHTAVEQIVMQIHDEASLSDVTQAFQQFLQAVGYSVPGTLELVDEVSHEQ